jgi:hypothetical protein
MFIFLLLAAYLPSLLVLSNRDALDAPKMVHCGDAPAFHILDTWDAIANGVGSGPTFCPVPRERRWDVLRNAASKVMWVGRATVFLVGLAVILSLVVGAASAAFGANGDAFLLGRRNAESAVSTLTKGGAGPALRLQVGSGAPLAVNSSKQVTNLNADMVDGKDVSQIGVRGLERVSVDSVDNPVSPKQQRLDCPTGKVMLSSGYDLSGGKVSSGTQSLLVVAVVQPVLNANGQPTGVLVEAYEIPPGLGATETWNVRVFGTCATAPS